MSVLWVYFALLGCSLAAPTIPEIDPEITEGLFQGDIDEVLNMRSGITNPAQHWPNGMIYYRISKVFDEDQVGQIKLAMKAIENISCLHFVEVDKTAENFVKVVGEPTGCHSILGYRSGHQKMNLKLFPLGKGCFILGKIIHELLHTIGFRHQQASPDRDDHVIINEENIIKGRENNFSKDPLLSNFGVPYDYGSIMHYGPLFSSKNGLPTIVALRPAEATQMGQREGLSDADIARINIMYNCTSQKTTEDVINTNENSNNVIVKQKET